MSIIKKKILPEYFEAILQGKKKYELRLNDFEAKEGDIFILEEWNEKYTGRTIEKKITYVGKFNINELCWTQKTIEEKGLQIISFE